MVLGKLSGGAGHRSSKHVGAVRWVCSWESCSPGLRTAVLCASVLALVVSCGAHVLRLLHSTARSERADARDFAGSEGWMRCFS